METLQKNLETIAREIAAASEHLAAIRAEMDRIEAAGMYPAVPSENWQSRNGSEPIYLYMVFRRDYRAGRYQGPEGKRKVYVGCDEAKIAEARRLVENRQRWERLEQTAKRLDWWIKSAVGDVHLMAVKLDRWPREENLG